MSAPFYALAGICVVGSVVTHILAPEGPIALTLALAGAGALTKLAVEKGKQADEHKASASQQKALADRERRRADALFEETQVLKRQS